MPTNRLSQRGQARVVTARRYAVKERLKTTLLAAITGATVGGITGWVLMEDEFPIYVFLGFTITFAAIGFFAKEEWKECIVDWILNKFSI